MNNKTLFDEGRMKSSKVDWILIVVFAFIAGWSAKYLYWPQSLSTSGTVSFAKIESLSNIVKSKSVGNLAWNDVQVGQSFKRKDLLFTYEKSRAKLTLEKGDNLEILPNSLVELDQLSGSTAIQVKEGLVYLDIIKGNPLKVNLGGQEISVTSESAKVKLTTSNGVSRLESAEGNLKIETQTGKIFDIDQDNQLEFNESNEAELFSYEVSLINPSDDQLITSGSMLSKVNFVYERTSGSKSNQLFVEISNDLSFVDSNRLEDTNVELPEGIYFWRIVNSKNKPVSSINTFEIEFVKKIIATEDSVELLEPKPLANLKITKPGEAISFSFNGSGIIELSRDKEFKSIVTSKEVRDSFEWEVEKLGRYFWRMKTNQSTSEVREFIIEPGDLLPAPEIDRAPSELNLTPIKPSSFLSFLISEAFAQDFAAEFEWGEVDQASGYIIEIYSSSDQSKLLKRQKVQANSFLWLGAPLRSVWWRVVAIDPWGREGIPSSLVETKLIAPSGWEETDIDLNSPSHRRGFDQNEYVEFNWDDKPGVNNWTFLLSKDLSFRNPELKRTDLPTGEWYWRITSLDSLGRKLISKRRKISIRKLTAVEVAVEEKRVNEYKLRLNLRSPFDVDFGLQVSKPNYELIRASQDFNLTGFSASGFNLNLSREISSYRVYSNLSWLSGKAFDSLGYHDSSLHLGLQKVYDWKLSIPIWIGAGFSMHRLSSYQRGAASNELSDTTLSAIGLHASLLAQPFVWGNKYLETELNISALSQVTISLKANYFVGKWFYGLGYEKQTLEKDGEISVSTMSLNFGYRWQR